MNTTITYQKEEFLHLLSKSNRKHYGINIKFTSEDGENNYDYEMVVDYKLFQDKQNTICILERDAIFINGVEPFYLIDEMAVVMSQSIYPIHISRNFLTNELRIMNHQEILSRWKNYEKTYNLNFGGDYAKKYIKQASYIINSNYNLENYLKRDLFWNLYFHPICVEYGKSGSIHTEMLFSILPFQNPLSFKGIQAIRKELSDYNTIQFLFNGETNFIYSENSKEFCKAELEVIYDINRFEFFISHIWANCKIIQNEKVIKTIQYNLYWLREREHVKIVPGNQAAKWSTLIDD